VLNRYSGDYCREYLFDAHGRIWFCCNLTLRPFLFISKFRTGNCPDYCEYEEAAKNDFLPDSSQEIMQKHIEFLEGVIENLKDKITFFESVEA
jgi:hypothetical protein